MRIDLTPVVRVLGKEPPVSSARSSYGFFAALLLMGRVCLGATVQEVSVASALESLFTPGVLFEDRNGDGVVDFVNDRIRLADGASAAEIAAGADVAMRLGFETWKSGASS